MTEQQLALIDELAVVKLTDRQQAVHDALAHAGQDGLTADEAGAIAHTLKEGRWAHSKHDRCQFCGKDGQAILQRLAQLGLARYRRANRQRSIHGAWLASNSPSNIASTPAEPQPDYDGDGPVPYNAFPSGY